MDKQRILVVEDESSIATMIQRRLEANDYEVLMAADGEEGLFTAQKERPDLIILDIMLPKMNGFKVARLLKFDSNYKNIPIIMLTARTQDSDIKLGGEVGGDIYMTKPFDSAELLDNIRKLLGE